jgi:hypothetical protein
MLREVEASWLGMPNDLAGVAHRIGEAIQGDPAPVTAQSAAIPNIEVVARHWPPLQRLLESVLYLRIPNGSCRSKGL